MTCRSACARRRRLRFPEDVRALLAQKFRSHRRAWLAGEGEWPIVISLGCPPESEAGIAADAVRDWVAAWRTWRGTGEPVWRERRWRTLGAQLVPEKVSVATACDVAAWIGEEDRWNRAASRYARFAARWPALAPRLPRYFDALADYSEADIARLEALLAWLGANPRSNVYPRQIPVAGMDTKWLEPRMPLIADLIGAEGATHYERCGLKEPPRLARIRLLDPALRSAAGGLGDITAPLEEIAGLPIRVSKAYIVENVQTGLCFGDIPGSAVFMGLGYGIGMLAQVPWLAEAECIYWGDIDTHGFAILSQARQCLPGLRSILMDECTLLRHRDLWTEEKEQAGAAELPMLTEAEQSVYRGLKQHHWGVRVRLEQERIAWDNSIGLRPVEPDQMR